MVLNGLLVVSRLVVSRGQLWIVGVLYEKKWWVFIVCRTSVSFAGDFNVTCFSSERVRQSHFIQI